jgi:argininosuccinate lyase
MENTGRITRSLTLSAQRIVFGITAEQSVMDELPFITQVDQAHLVMLAEQQIVSAKQVAVLLAAIGELRLQQFAPLRGRSALRGVYLLYEDYLREKLGPEVGGILQTARSRNDLNATVLRLRLRVPYITLVSEALRLQAILQQRARQYRDVVMPAYTHYQPAVPITYGHYLAGVAVSLERELDALLDIAFDLQSCPLGAGAVGGTSLPIQPTRTAELLGFDRPVLHSIKEICCIMYVQMR